MIKESEWKWQGLPGHFVCADRCLFHLCTHVGNYKISTVGAWYDKDKKLREVGLGRHYETYVFKIDDLGEVSDWCEIDSDFVYCGEGAIRSNEEFDKQAEEVHLKMCYKYAKIN